MITVPSPSTLAFRLIRFPRSCCTILAAVLLAAPARASGQEGRVAGYVLSELRPLPGAQVLVEETGRAVFTDEAGRFLIDGLTGTRVTLRVEMLGYRSRTVSVAVGEQAVRIELTPSALELDALVVTGTPAQTQRRAIGNSIVSIDAAQALSASAAPDMTSLLQGRAAGVVLTPGSGRAGAGPSISIRGLSSISLDQQPLLYIDGVRVNNEIGRGPRGIADRAISRLNDINPADIESIEIIKGPAAATLYGTEASNGVIQIITKRGLAGSRPRFTVTVRQGTSWFADAEEQVRTNYARVPGTDTVLSFNAVRYERARGRELFERGNIQGYALSVRGGGQSLQYYISSAYDREKGVEPGNDFWRFTSHVNLGLAATDALDIQTSVNLAKGRTRIGGGTNGSILLSAMMGNPLLERLGAPSGPYLAYTPDVYRRVFENWQDLTRFTGSLRLEHRPAGWFQQRLTVGLDQTIEDNHGLTKFVPPDLAGMFSPTDARGELLQDVRHLAFLTADYSASVTAPISADVTSTTSIGGQYYRRRTDVASLTAEEFPAPGLSTASAAARVTGSGSPTTNATLGLYVQEQIAWRNRLFLTAALRVDNNSAFGEDIDFVTYPKVSGTWVVSDEPFWNVGAVDQLRVRAAFGASGQQPQAFAALRTFSPATGTQDQPIVVPQSLGNPNLKPERGEELEVGFDASLFQRVGVDFTYFTKRTKDAILQRAIAPSTGFSGAQFVNIGETANSGFEAQLNARIVERPNLGWGVTLSLSHVRDEIVDLGGIDAIPLGLPMQRHVEGYPIGGFWTRRIVSAEVDANGVPQNILCDDGQGGAVACSSAPLLYFGTPTPKYSGAISTTLTLWNRLQIFGLVDFKTGHHLFNANEFVRCTFVKVCWENAHPTEADPILLAATYISGDFSAVSPFIEKGRYAKLRELSLAYTPPESWVRGFGAERATITLAARNLHTWTAFSGSDPEGRANVGNALLSNDQAAFPILPQVVTTINLTF